MQGQEQKRGFYLCGHTGQGCSCVILHVGSCCIAVSTHAASHVVGCCIRVAARHAVLHVVRYYVIVTARAISCAMLGMLSQFGCCIRDAAAAVMETPPKFLEAKSKGLVDLLVLFSFPKGKLKRVFVLFGLC